MSEKTQLNSDNNLDRAIGSVRDDSMDEASLEAAAARVWGSVAQEVSGQDAAHGATIGSCADYQRLMPDLVAGNLTEARALLVEDHAATCMTCRKALDRERRGESASRPDIALVGANEKPAIWQRLPLQAIAAVAIVALGLAGLRLAGDLFVAEPVLASAEAIDGALYRVSDSDSVALSAGDQIRAGEVIRAGRDGGGILSLTDGTKVEMDAGSELAVAKSASDANLQLARGNIIVSAAPQGDGHLRVLTDDCAVSVTGTVFVVRHGAKGSRVSVLEGEVVVTQDDGDTVLLPGHQITTDPRLGTVEIHDEVDWSRDVDDYIALLSELKGLRQDLKAVTQPELRYEARLLSAVPADTAIYVGLPNVSSGIAEAHELLEARMADSDVLREWWSSGTPIGGDEGGDEPSTADVVELVEKFGGYLGEEIVLASALDDVDLPSPPVIFAEVADAEGFRATFEAEVARLVDEYGDPGEEELTDTSPLRFVDTSELVELAAQVEPTDVFDEEHLLIWMGEGLLVAGVRADQVIAAIDNSLQPDGSGFEETPFGGQVAAAYEDGVAWLLAADMGRIVAGGMTADAAPEESQMLDQLGVMDVDTLVISQRSVDETSESRAVLTFDGPRQGIASWLAEPGPMGALNFISGDAYVASAFVVRDPAALLDEMIGFAGIMDSDFEAEISELEHAERLSLARALAAGLGGEFAVALDGPVLPEPSWKLVAEVYDADALQSAMEGLIGLINHVRADEPESLYELVPSTIGDRPAYTLLRGDGDEILHYVIVDGYMVVAPARVLLERAIQAAELGSNITSADSFTSRLPHDGRADMSAVFYQNLEPVLAPLLSGLSKTSQALSPEQQEAIGSLGRDLTASLAYAYAEDDRIILASTSESGPFGLDISHLMGLGGMMGLGGDVFEGLDH